MKHGHTIPEQDPSADKNSKQTTGLTPAERRAIDEHIAQVPVRQSAAIDALVSVQASRGWVSDEALLAVADHLGMSAAELDSIATFYNLIFRKPVGRHRIMVCDSISCWVMGCGQLQGALQRQLGIELGQTTRDGRFTLLPIQCLGACAHAPTMMVDDDLHRDLKPEAVEQQLERVLEQYD